MPDIPAGQAPDSGAGRKLPVVPLAGNTLVFHEAERRQLFRIAGVLVLPLGAEIELPDGQNVEVTRVRLLAPGVPGDPVTVCLGVKPMDR
jgi:hypothetical protein